MQSPNLKPILFYKLDYFLFNLECSYIYYILCQECNSLGAILTCPETGRLSSLCSVQHKVAAGCSTFQSKGIFIQFLSVTY